MSHEFLRPRWPPGERLTERAAALSKRLAHDAGRESLGFASGGGAGRGGEIPEGTRIGPYRIVRQIGRGGMAHVYDAAHEALRRRVALKVSKPDDPDDPQCRERLLLEALILERLDHPNVARLHDVGVLGDGRAWIAMELVEGESLTQHLARAPISLDDGCELLADIGRALAAAHAGGVVHRDLKPDNVLVLRSRRPRCKVIDWGIARSRALPQARFTEQGVVSGTPLYMAPEQARGREVDGRCDIYSLGVMAYEMFCGEPPFDAENSVAILMRHIHEQPRPPISLRRDLPLWMNDLVLAMLAKEPGDRPTLERIEATLVSRGRRELDTARAEHRAEDDADLRR